MSEKLFITFTPQQTEGRLVRAHYIPVGNTRLEYGETRFPIIPVINGYTEKGNSIRVLEIIQNKESCWKNSLYLEEELEELCKAKGIEFVLEKIEVPYNNSVSTDIDVFQHIIDHIGDDSDIHACITYGNKPSPMIELMAIRYARKIKKDAFISCVVYGEVDHDLPEHPMKIYDETALVLLDDIMGVLAESKCDNPADMLRKIMGD